MDFCQERVFDTNGIVDIRDCTSPATKPRWTHQEDYLLISSWLNTSKDRITGPDGYWKVLTKHFNAHVASIGAHPRKLGQCKDHWNRNVKLVVYFASCYKRAVDLNRSGWNDANYLDEAKSLFRREKNKDFILLHWWVKLKDEPKWNAEYMQQNSSTLIPWWEKVDNDPLNHWWENAKNESKWNTVYMQQNALKKTKVSEGAYTSSSNPDDSEGSVNKSRPIEHKIAKKKGEADKVQQNELKGEANEVQQHELKEANEVQQPDSKGEANNEVQQNEEQQPELKGEVNNEVQQNEEQQHELKGEANNEVQQNEEQQHEPKGEANEVQKNELQSEYLALESKRLAILETIAASNVELAASYAKIAAAKVAKVEVLKIQAESKNFSKALDILAKDTSRMSETQLAHHYELCYLWKRKYFSM